MSITTTVNTDDIVAQIEAIEQRFREAIRPAAFAGAKVYYNEVMMRVPVSDQAHIFRSGTRDKATGKVSWTGQEYLFYPGDLKRSIYIAHSDDNSTPGSKETYHISWRKSGPNSVPYAHWIEYGTSKQQARPFLRPAYEAAKGRAEAEMKRVLQEAVNGSGN